MYLSDRAPTNVAGSERATTTKIGPTVLLMGVVSLLTDISSESVSAVLPLYVTAFLGLSPLAYGVVDGLYQGVSAVVRLLGGWLADRTDRPKWVAFTGYAVSAVTKVAFLGAQGFGAVSALVTVDRLGKGLRTAPRDAVIATSAPPEALGRAFGVHRALDTVGAALGPLVAFVILWRMEGEYDAVFIVSFVAALLGLAVLGLLVPDVRPGRSVVAGVAAASAAPALLRSDGVSPTNPTLRSLLRGRLGKVAVVAGLLGVLTISDGFLYLSLQQRDDLAAQYFPLLFVGTNVAFFTFAIPLGRLSDRVGRHRVFIAGHVLLVGAYACAVGSSGGLLLTVACLALLGSFYAATDGVLSALVAGIAPVNARARSLAAIQTVVAVTRFASSLLFGLLWSQLGRGPAVLCFAVALIAVLPLARVLLRSAQESRQGHETAGAVS